MRLFAGSQTSISIISIMYNGPHVQVSLGHVKMQENLSEGLYQIRKTVNPAAKYNNNSYLFNCLEDILGKVRSGKNNNIIKSG